MTIHHQSSYEVTGCSGGDEGSSKVVPKEIRGATFSWYCFLAFHIPQQVPLTKRQEPPTQRRKDCVQICTVTSEYLSSEVD